jgi:hypothetical protein
MNIWRGDLSEFGVYMGDTIYVFTRLLSHNTYAGLQAILANNARYL